MANNAMDLLTDHLHKSRVKFGTDGIRGKAGAVLTPTLLLNLGYLVGTVLPNKGPVLIGNDSRISGAMAIAALTAGLTTAGREVWALGLCPTPAVANLIKKLGISGGLMVSASHNPPEDNGIKVFGADGAKINSDQQKTIETKLNTNSIESYKPHENTNFGQSYYRPELLNHYRKALLASVEQRRLSNIPIVLDLCWGSATAFGADVFEALGANVSILHGKADGNRINLGCGSTQIEKLRSAVINQGAEMGFAFDGDADRMLAVDSTGRIIDGDHVLYLWGSILYEKNDLPNQRLVATVMSNLGFERAWTKKGGILERTPVGDHHVHAAMLANGAALGGEQSGHILSAAHGLCGDGLLTALQLATLCNEKQITLSEWMNQSFQPFPQRLANVPMANHVLRQNWKSCTELLEAIANAEEAMGTDGRVLVRESGTEPLLRVMVEAVDPAVADSWTAHLTEVIHKQLNNL